MSISQLNPTETISSDLSQYLREEISIDIYEPLSPEGVVSNIAKIDGQVDVYCWYEGCRNLPQSGALFMRHSIFEPLHARKKDAKLCLYSLKGWDFRKTVQNMQNSTPIGEAINKINKMAIECFYSMSFFQFCASVFEGDLYSYISSELPKKKWLYALSENHRPTGRKISELFDDRSSLFDCINTLDVAQAYSLMQYVEGYYLIRESIKNKLNKNERKIEIVFALPNDEGKYYQDLPNDVRAMLRSDFGETLRGLSIHISFMFFNFGENQSERPYIDKKRNAPQVKPKEIPTHFNYLERVELESSKLEFDNGY